MARRRIAVLGGGPASLAAVFAITSGAGWDKRYAITVYQQGWRLGGKGASSLNPDARFRNEEHGLHVLGGFYHNAFALLREVYAAWAGSDFERLFDERFVKHGHCTLQEVNAGGWRTIDFDFPTDDRRPGVDPSEPTIRSIIELVVRWIRSELDNQSRHKMVDPDLERARVEASRAEAAAERLAAASHEKGAGLPPFLLAALRALLPLLLRIEKRVRPRGREPNLFTVAAVGTVVVIGILEDQLFEQGFDKANSEELGDWLRRHGATDRLVGSPYVRAGYDYAFAYLDGQTSPPRPALAAGVALRATMRMLLTYHGALFYHMTLGMGEAVFVPLYEVLKARGVSFAFFHRVAALRLSADGAIAGVDGRVQAEPLAAEYDPLIPHAGRRAWPVRPRYDQLVDGPVLASEGDDFESDWAPDRHRGAFRLERGADFDDVILGIPVGALPAIAGDVARRVPKFAAMLGAARTIPTAAVQLWSAQTTVELGGPHTLGLVTAYEQPFSTWADMSFLVALEAEPRFAHLSYLCGPLDHRAPAGDGFPAAEATRAAGLADAWCDQALAHLLPKAHRASFAERYVRANVSASERYVLSPPGSIDARLKAGESGVANLYLAGDWTRTGLDAGAFEAAVMSGLQAARALTGRDIVVFGERDRR